MLTSSVQGFDDLFKAMDDLALEIGQAKTDRIWKKAMGYAMSPVLAQVKANAPRDSGQLAEHIYMKTQRPTSRDKASASYKGEIFMCRVTSGPKRMQDIENTTIGKGGKERVYRKFKPVGVAMEFGTAHIAARPFVRPALASNVGTVIDRLGKMVWAEVNWGKYAKGKKD
jgi:HK97 gp10 family phage protein